MENIPAATQIGSPISMLTMPESADILFLGKNSGHVSLPQHGFRQSQIGLNISLILEQMLQCPGGLAPAYESLPFSRRFFPASTAIKVK